MADGAAAGPFWDALGAIGEIVGAVAVVATLAYLAAQIRQNTKASNSATRQAISDAIMAPPMNFVQNADFRAAFNAHVNNQPLDADQVLQLQAYCYINFRLWENIHFQHLNGTLSAHEWAAFRRNLKAFAQVPMMQDYWDRESEVYTDRFREEVDAIFAELREGSRSVPRSVIHPENERG